jgi:hypothetical protein
MSRCHGDVFRGRLFFARACIHIVRFFGDRGLEVDVHAGKSGSVHMPDPRFEYSIDFALRKLVAVPVKNIVAPAHIRHFNLAYKTRSVISDRVFKTNVRTHFKGVSPTGWSLAIQPPLSILRSSMSFRVKPWNASP